MTSTSEPATLSLADLDSMFCGACRAFADRLTVGPVPGGYGLIHRDVNVTSGLSGVRCVTDQRMAARIAEQTVELLHHASRAALGGDDPLDVFYVALLDQYGWTADLDAAWVAARQAEREAEAIMDFIHLVVAAADATNKALDGFRRVDANNLGWEVRRHLTGAAESLAAIVDGLHSLVAEGE